MKRMILLPLLALTVGSFVWAQPESAPEGRPPRRRGRPPAVERYFEQLQQQNPEEMKRLRELRQTDPEAFRRELRARVQRRKQQRNPEEKRFRAHIREHAESVRSATTPEERQEALEQLRLAVAERIDHGFEMRQQALDDMREKLEALDRRHQEEKRQRETLIDGQVDRILKRSEDSTGSAADIQE